MIEQTEMTGIMGEAVQPPPDPRQREFDDRVWEALLEWARSNPGQPAWATEIGALMMPRQDAKRVTESLHRLYHEDRHHHRLIYIQRYAGLWRIEARLTPSEPPR